MKNSILERIQQFADLYFEKNMELIRNRLFEKNLHDLATNDRLHEENIFDREAAVHRLVPIITDLISKHALPIHVNVSREAKNCCVKISASEFEKIILKLMRPADTSVQLLHNNNNLTIDLGSHPREVVSLTLQLPHMSLPFQSELTAIEKTVRRWHGTFQAKPMRSQGSLILITLPILKSFDGIPGVPYRPRTNFRLPGFLAESEIRAV